MADTEIKILDNGPFLVSGSISLTDTEGQKFDTAKQPVALCRCGASGNRPFCDGSHGKVNFNSAERAK
ncbi:MAG: CDGSH iron-sulfur domain-containing protein [Calothrix sp. MO_167.B12]|nr:CDGSH iron-sulfur domain-containing protein [Calothrix sp. MO_167.B12]